MKKLLCVLLALAACCLLVTATAAADTVPTTCAACGTAKTWEVMPSAIPEASGHYHYYLSADVTPSQLLVKDGVTMCLDLNGHSINTNGRSMIVYNGSAVNIMDSSAAGNGYMSGSTGSNNSAGGTITVQETGTLKLYSGTLKFVNDGVGNTPTYSGCVLSMRGTMYMYGGRIEGGDLAYVNGKTVAGGAIHVGSAGKLTVTGGKITSGVLPEGGVGACVYLSASGSKLTLSGNANIEEIYSVAKDNLTVTGTFSGKARLKFGSAVTPAAGLVVGTTTNASITGDLFCTNGDGWLVNASGSDLKLAAFTPSADRHYCQHCKEVVKWKTFSSGKSAAANGGVHHLYLSASYNGTQFSVNNGSQVCLDLYGTTLTGTGRAVYQYGNTVLNIMDTQSGGAVVGTTGTNNPTGGAMVIKSGAVCNLYSGTLRLEDTYLAGYGVGVGGIVYMNESGTMNVYGGTIEGADLVLSEYNMSLHGLGAAFYMNASAQLNVYGGQIKSGTLAEGCVGECVYLRSSTAQVNLYGSGSVEDIYFTSEQDQLTVSGDYTGTVNLTYPDTVSLAENLVVGVSDSADLSAANATCGNEWMLAVSGSDLVLAPNAQAIVYSATGTRTYHKLQDAIDNAGDGYVKLMQPVIENVTVRKDLYLDLNGKTVDGTVTVAAGATLYGMDSQTDDYTIQDAAGYGTLTVAGEGKVLGVPEEFDIAKHGYMKITEGENVSFHCVNLELSAMTLRAEDAGVYYKSVFGGDEMVAARVTKYGVALSIKSVPTAENLDKDCRYSALPAKFTAGGMDADAASTLLKGVMKTNNAPMINNRNAQLPIYGRAYILTEDGYMFGASAQRSFREQVEGADDIWKTLNATQKASVVAMYDTYRDIMENWDIPNVIAQKDPSGDGVMKILGIGNSYTIDCMHLLNEVYQAEDPGTKLQLGIAYYSGCTLANHVKFYNEESAVYTYYYLDSDTGKWVTTANMTLQQIISAQNWDLVSMQQGSGTSGVASTYNSDIQTIQKFVDKLLGYTPTFFWNMTWAYPQIDIPTDNYTLENAPNANNFKNYYGSSQQTMYNMIMATVQEKIVPDTTFQWIMPVGTTVQNAQSSYMTDLDLYRDYTHLSDFARLMAAYTWYCRLEGKTLDSVQLTKVPAALKKSYTGAGDMVLTQDQINVLVESVKNACTTMFEVTPSQYTTK